MRDESWMFYGGVGLLLMVLGVWELVARLRAKRGNAGAKPLED